MQEHQTKTMAETFCSVFQVDPEGEKKSSTMRIKGLNAAFPRKVVMAEVRRILTDSQQNLPEVTGELVMAMMDDWNALPCDGIRLPLRHEGGLLFGQLKPRFDNRIISTCPVSKGKVSSKKCSEFLLYRWAMILSNIRVTEAGSRKARPLNSGEITALQSEMVKAGHLTPTEIKKIVRHASRCEEDNLDALFLHPDAKEALTLDPVKHEIQKAPLLFVWEFIPHPIQRIFQRKLERGKSITLAEIRDILVRFETNPEMLEKFDEGVQKALKAAPKPRGKKKGEPVTLHVVLTKPVSAKIPSGRAPYSRDILREASETVFRGEDPREKGGCLYRSESIREEELNFKLTQQTNNHLIRHRLLILERLLDDLIQTYAEGDSNRIRQVVIEVNSELRDLSGKTSKEMAQEMGALIAHHHAVAQKLEEVGIHNPSAGLIRKARIADDLGMKCPFTGKEFDLRALASTSIDLDHIIPRSYRPSDSLDSLVVTSPEVNRMKGQRTAFEFIKEDGGKPVPGRPNLTIMTLAEYKAFVENLDTRKGHSSDQARKKNRKRLLLTPSYEEKEFVPRDLTTTSHLVRLGAQVLRRAFSKSQTPPKVISIPGSVTGVTRKNWNLLGLISAATPEVLDENGRAKIKKDIRSISHLHHALDAIVLGLCSYVIPNEGRCWELLVKRKWNEKEQAELKRISSMLSFDSQQRLHLEPVPERIQNEIRAALAEKRVVQHIPAEMNGLPAEETIYRILDWNDPHPSAQRLISWAHDAEIKQPDDDSAIIITRKRKEKGSKAPKKLLKETPQFYWAYDIVKKAKLLGSDPVGSGAGKLKPYKSVKIIGSNYGVALDPEPKIIVWHKVWPQIKEIQKANGGKMPRILRNGQVIHIPKGRYQGAWRVFSIKGARGGELLDIGALDNVSLKSGQHYRNVRLKTLIKDGLAILSSNYAGPSEWPTTSSTSTPPSAP